MIDEAYNFRRTPNSSVDAGLIEKGERAMVVQEDHLDNKTGARVIAVRLVHLALRSARCDPRRISFRRGGRRRLLRPLLVIRVPINSSKIDSRIVREKVINNAANCKCPTA